MSFPKAQIMLIEPVGTINTGEVINERTVADNIWV
jgi:hypothetical protein